MITEERAIRLLSEANPVPDASTLDVNLAFRTTRLVEYGARSSEMTEMKYERSDPQAISSQRRFAGIASAIAVLVVAGVYAFITTDELPVVADQPASIEVATAFVEAYASFDVDLASSYLAADVDLSLLDGGQQEWRLGNRWLQATGAELLLGTCEELGSSAPATSVRCPFDFYGLRSNEIGLGPYSGSSLDLTVDDGEITSAAMSWANLDNGFSREMWEPFAVWVGATYPEDFPIMYENGIKSARETEESIDLWERRLVEYVAEVKAQGEADGATTGLPGLAPVGAAPSTPENGELVASMWEHQFAPGSFGNGWLYLYADGRLLWERQNSYVTHGLLERRLTRAGVELIRSEIIATGLFDPDQPPPAPNDDFPGGGMIQVRNGDQLVYVDGFVPDLFERLADLWSWLPDSAWEDTDPKAYVPSRYAVCGIDEIPIVSDGSVDLSALPAAARDLLAGARKLRIDALADVDPGGMAWAEGSSEYCYDLTTEEARTLARTLEDAGAQTVLEPGSQVAYLASGSFEEYENGSSNAIVLTMWPMLPHGIPAFNGA